MGQFSQSDTPGDLRCIFSGSGWSAALTPCSTCAIGFLAPVLLTLRHFLAVVFSAAIFVLTRRLR
jgi:hypothetical protein